VNPVAQTIRSAGRRVPSSSSAKVPSSAAVRRAHDVFHLAGRHEVQALQLELADRRRADRVDHPGADAVARAVQELLHAARAQVLEQRLAHPGEQQHLEVDDAADLARHLPQQMAGDHVGARRRLADGHGHVAG
jgi:hypothetical protein